MASTNAEANSLRNTARATWSSFMLASFRRRNNHASRRLADELVADPIAQPRKDEDVEGKHATAQHRKLVARDRGFLRLLRPARGERALDHARDRPIGERGDDRTDDRADHAAEADVHH